MKKAELQPVLDAQGHLPATGHPLPASEGRSRWGELGFLGIVFLALVGVLLSGRFAYREASLFQTAKDNGQALLKWVGDMALAHEAHPGPLSCSGSHTTTDVTPRLEPLTWALCRQELLGEQGRLAGMANPFAPQAPVFSSACERGNYAGRGAVVLEKGTPSPPGFPPSISYASIEDAEPMVKGLLLRVMVCDPSGYGVRVGEGKL